MAMIPRAASNGECACCKPEEGGMNGVCVHVNQNVTSGGGGASVEDLEAKFDDRYAAKEHGIHLTQTEQENVRKLGATSSETETGLTGAIADTTHIEIDGDQSEVFGEGMYIRIGGKTVLIKSVVFDGEKTILEVEEELGDGGPISIVTVIPPEIDMEAVQRAVLAQIATHDYDPAAHSAVISAMQSELSLLRDSIMLYVPPSEVAITSPEVQLEPGGTYQLGATVAPPETTNKTISWVSNNTAAATVDATGLVTAVADGTATITATTQDGGISAACNVMVATVPVTVAVTGVSLNVASQSVAKNAIYQLVATIQPLDATNKTVTWSSSNASVATVDETGKVTAKAAGTATITATTTDGGKKATCAITVVVSVTGVVVAPTTVSLNPGGAYQLAATVQPSDASNKGVSWISSKTSVATVSSSGRVTAVAAGSATITVTTADGAKKAYCTVTVTNPTPPPRVLLTCQNCGTTYYQGEHNTDSCSPR